MTLKYLQPTNLSRLVFSIILIFFALYLFFSGTLFGIVLLGAAVKLALKEGIEIDLDGIKYRKLYSLFTIEFGSWKLLPKIEYISVFKTQKKSRSRVIAAEANLNFVVYKINLFYDRNKHIEAYVSEEKEEALKVAQKISSALSLEVYDATQED